MESLKNLYNEIIESTRDIENVMLKLKNISGNTIIIGTGGSKVVATFASMVLESKNNLITRIVDARDFTLLDKSKYSNVFISSYSGSNFGVKNSLICNLNKYLLTTRKTKIMDEEILNYNMKCEHSFISLKSTIIPMSILLKYYLGDQFESVLKEIFKCIRRNLNLDIKDNYINIFSGIDTKVAEVFLESSLTESGLAIPLIHEKYSYCHGRSTINKNHSSSTIYLGYKQTDLDDKLLAAIDISSPSKCILNNEFDDLIVNNFYLTLECLYLLENLANKNNINLKNIKYDKDIVKELYYFKGSM